MDTIKTKNQKIKNVMEDIVQILKIVLTFYAVVENVKKLKIRKRIHVPQKIIVLQHHVMRVSF